MTTRYQNKESALNMGIFYARGKMDIKIEDLKRVEDVESISQMDFNDLEHKKATAEVYELTNSKGKNVMIGVTKDFQEDCWYLWLIDPVTGMALRT